MASIRKEQEDTQEKYEQLLIANKKLEADKLSQEMDIKSLQAQLVATQQTATKLETDLEEAKVANRESELLRQEYDMLQNRYQRLEQEAEVSEKQTDELKSKYEQDSCITARVGKHFRLTFSSLQSQYPQSRSRKPQKRNGCFRQTTSGK